MELKNMTNKELTNLINEMKNELKERKEDKIKEYESKLSDLISEIIRNGYEIKIDGYNRNSGYDTRLIFNNYYDIYYINIE